MDNVCVGGDGVIYVEVTNAPDASLVIIRAAGVGEDGVFSNLLSGTT